MSHAPLLGCRYANPATISATIPDRPRATPADPRSQTLGMVHALVDPHATELDQQGAAPLWQQLQSGHAIRRFLLVASARLLGAG
jgi:hypothetical protein